MDLYGGFLITHPLIMVMFLIHVQRMFLIKKTSILGNPHMMACIFVDPDSIELYIMDILMDM